MNFKHKRFHSFTSTTALVATMIIAFIFFLLEAIVYARKEYIFRDTNMSTGHIPQSIIGHTDPQLQSARQSLMYRHLLPQI
jgi:hypothetical protein